MADWWESAPTVDQAGPIIAGPVNTPDDPRGGNNWWEGAPEVRAPSPNQKPKGYNPQGDIQSAAGFMTNLKASMSPDINKKIAIYSNSMGIPVNRFGVIDGNIVYGDDQGTIHRVQPSVRGSAGPMDAFMRAGQFVGANTGEQLPTLTGGATGIAMGPTGMSVPASAAVSGVTDLGRQAVGNWLADKPAFDLDPINAAGQAVLGGAGQGLGVGVSKMATKNPMGVAAWDSLNALDPNRRAATTALVEEARKRGITLSAGQATGLQSLRAQERQLGRYPETADRMSEFRANQRDVQVPGAIRAELDTISPKYGEEAISSFRGGSQGVEDAATEARQKAAQDLYEEAFKANQNVQSKEIDRILDTPAGRDALRRTAVKMQNARTNVAVPDAELTDQARLAAELGKIEPMKGGVASGLKLRTLDYVKRSLGDVEQNALQSGNRDDARIIGDLRRGLTRELDKLDVTAQAGPNSLKPEGGAYLRARQSYGTGSDALETIQDGGVGFINNMAGMDRQNIVNRVFSAQNITPEGVSRARSQFEMAGKLDDWNAGLKSFLSDKLDDAMKVNAGGERGNVPGKFYANVWGDDRQQAIVKAAFGSDPQRLSGFGSLMDVLKAASKSLPEGSPTATDLPAGMGIQTLGKGAQLLGKATSPSTYMNLGSDIVAGIDALRTPGARIKLADALLSGDYDKQLSQLRMLQPTSQKALAITSQILMGTGVSLSGLRTPNDVPVRDAAPKIQDPQ